MLASEMVEKLRQLITDNGDRPVTDSDGTVAIDVTEDTIWGEDHDDPDIEVFRVEFEE